MLFRIALWQVDAVANPTEALRGSIVMLGGELLGFVEGPDHCSFDFVAGTKTPCSIGSGTANFAKNLPYNEMFQAHFGHSLGGSSWRPAATALISRS